MLSDEMDASDYARQRLAVPIFAFGGVLLALIALVNGSSNWALNAGLLLAGAQCLIASYLMHRSLRRGRGLPLQSRRLIFALSGVVIVLMLIAFFL